MILNRFLFRLKNVKNKYVALSIYGLNNTSPLELSPCSWFILIASFIWDFLYVILFIKL